jgi:hypothetical protein
MIAAADKAPAAPKRRKPLARLDMADCGGDFAAALIVRILPHPACFPRFPSFPEHLSTPMLTVTSEILLAPKSRFHYTIL